MTSEEIRAKSAIELSTNSWLKEVCLQLALMNERAEEEAAPIIEPISPEPEIPAKRGPGRPRKAA